MPSTIQDFGRSSARYGNIAFYYAFPIKFWFGQSMLMPEDVLTWCRANCKGYYKVTCYTHEDSVRKGRAFLEKIMYVDKIYLSSEEDAAAIQKVFTVKTSQVKRPKLKRKVRRHGKAEQKVVSPTSAEGIAAATRKHAAKTGKKTVAKKATPAKTTKRGRKADTKTLPLFGS